MMRKSLIVYLLFVVTNLPGQEKPLQSTIKSLKERIQLSSKAKKLALLDSLCKVTQFQRNLNYDSIAEAAVAYAFELDSAKFAVRHMSNLIFYYTNRAGNPQEGMRIFNDFLEKKLNVSDSKLLAQMYTDGGDSYYFSGKRKESIDFYDKAEQFALSIQDSLRYALARRYKAGAHSDLGDYVTAFKLLTEVVDIFNRRKDTMNVISTRLSIATLYNKIGFLEESKKEREEIIAIGRRIHHHESLVPNLFNASLEEDQLGNQKARIKHLNEAYQHIIEPGFNSGIAPVIRYGLLSAYSENDSLVKAKNILQIIKKDLAKRKVIPYEDFYRLALSDYYYYVTKEYKKSLVEAKWVLAYRKTRYSIMGVNNANKRLSKIYQALGDSNNSYKHYVDYITLKDSVNSVQKTQALTYYQTLYETEKRDAKIAEQESKITLLDQQNKEKQGWMLFGGIGLLTLFTIVYLYRLSIYAKRKEELQQDFTKNLIKERENERIHLARELHDSIGQKMMLLTKKTKSVGDDSMQDLAKNTLDELREISRELYPAVLERLGLSKSIEALIDEVDRKSKIFFTHEIENIDEDITKESAIHVYRLIQEALSNMLQHSKAKAASITIKKETATIKAVIKDNGVGFTVPDITSEVTSFGIKTFFERAKILNATVHIDSKINNGTVIDLVLPI
ncbi:sensor histidine kinase [Flavobacteriaceae bacterium S356]|uniref:histidine kinase n=1 Tax=Asprobacillus argus TaxID=3076534 RepID=A0ABU3LCL6_9FLAO|nr:sensor histidine kinase [Flavobacteriaceae bacterium S356]